MRLWPAKRLVAPGPGKLLPAAEALGVALLLNGLHVVVKLVQQRDAGGDVHAGDDVVGDVVEVPGATGGEGGSGGVAGPAGGRWSTMRAAPRRSRP